MAKEKLVPITTLKGVIYRGDKVPAFTNLEVTPGEASIICSAKRALPNDDDHREDIADAKKAVAERKAKK